MPISSKPEIVNALKRAGNEGLQFWSDFPPEQFAAPIGTAWSPGDSVRHLVLSTKPLIKALGTPKMGLRFAFGKPDAPSRGYDELHQIYLDALGDGVDVGKFAPAPVTPNDPVGWQAEVIGELRTAIAELTSSIDGWEEDDLENYLLPHPLLGKLTVREMLFFTLFHYQHHQDNVTRRLRESH